MTWEEMDEAGISPCAYKIEGKSMRVESRGTGLWALVDGGECLNKHGLWEYEPQPSSRHADFQSRCRCTLDEALRLLRDVTQTLSTFAIYPNKSIARNSATPM
jgi:hypothetical protein